MPIYGEPRFTVTVLVAVELSVMEPPVVAVKVRVVALGIDATVAVVVAYPVSFPLVAVVVM
jgi:hypothetical protein